MRVNVLASRIDGHFPTAGRHAARWHAAWALLEYRDAARHAIDPVDRTFNAHLSQASASFPAPRFDASSRLD